MCENKYDFFFWHENKIKNWGYNYLIIFKQYLTEVYYDNIKMLLNLEYVKKKLSIKWTCLFNLEIFISVYGFSFYFLFKNFETFIELHLYQLWCWEKAHIEYNAILRTSSHCSEVQLCCIIIIKFKNFKRMQGIALTRRMAMRNNIHLIHM